MKKFFNRTLTGIKRGISTPTLPAEILKFQQNPLIRILRIIGGFSTLSLLGRSFINLNGPIIYILIIFTSIF
jgi:hypothetical protein